MYTCAKKDLICLLLLLVRSYSAIMQFEEYDIEKGSMFEKEELPTDWYEYSQMLRKNPPDIKILNEEEYSLLLDQLPLQVLQHAFHWYIRELRVQELPHWKKEGFFALKKITNQENFRLHDPVCFTTDPFRNPNCINCEKYTTAHANFDHERYLVVYFGEHRNACVGEYVPSKIHDLACMWQGGRNWIRSSSVKNVSLLSSEIYHKVSSEDIVKATRKLLLKTYLSDRQRFLYGFARYKMWQDTHTNEHHRRESICKLFAGAFKQKFDFHLSKWLKWTWKYLFIHPNDPNDVADYIDSMAVQMYWACKGSVFPFRVFWNPNDPSGVDYCKNSILRFPWHKEELEILLESEPFWFEVSFELGVYDIWFNRKYWGTREFSNETNDVFLSEVPK